MHQESRAEHVTKRILKLCNFDHYGKVFYCLWHITYARCSSSEAILISDTAPYLRKTARQIIQYIQVKQFLLVVSRFIRAYAGLTKWQNVSAEEFAHQAG